MSRGMASAPKQRERTFIMVKPDAVQRGLVGQIITYVSPSSACARRVPGAPGSPGGAAGCPPRALSCNPAPRPRVLPSAAPQAIRAKGL